MSAAVLALRRASAQRLYVPTAQGSTLRRPCARALHASVRAVREKKEGGEFDFSDKPTTAEKTPGKDARLFTTEYQHLRDSYSVPKHPVMLCHGLCGFDSIDILPAVVPAFSYWHGIKEALTEKGVEVYTAAVAPTSSIETRAEYLLSAIMNKIPKSEDGTRHVNLVGHSMGGLDARYVISKLIPERKAKITVYSLTTIATPHRGSYIADLLVQSSISPDRFPGLYKLLPSHGFDTNNPDGFKELTRAFMTEKFNPQILDDPAVAYFSYGARANPGYFNVFRHAWSRLYAEEGPNDGMVSVDSAKWGQYIGTIDNVDHLDLINFTNLLKYNMARWFGQPMHFNAVALYLHITDMLAEKGF